ncbi:uncharacterized protein LOC143122000 isoform X2 [Alosa pseudoharengus]|uniref:uncharacterized protein LOC143122000 isoform X2 n=1 Tax=Alosa pseudoharengus TaxID=34774 RepID=UPI003F8C16D0
MGQTREDHQKDDPEGSCKSCAAIPDTCHWVLIKPEVSKKKRFSTYRLNSPAGSYKCSESGLRWSCASPVTLQYHYEDWDVFAKKLGHMRFRPVGPLMDIKLIYGELGDIHLPHFLCLGGYDTSLHSVVKVLCWQQDCGVLLEECELTRNHGKLPYPSFSLIGLIWDSWNMKDINVMFPTRVHAEVLVYQSSTQPLTYRVYLLPADACLKHLVVRDEEMLMGVKLVKHSPDQPLQLDSSYKLKTDCSSKIFPKTLRLGYGKISPKCKVEVIPPENHDSFWMKLYRSVGSSWEYPWIAEFHLGDKEAGPPPECPTRTRDSQSPRIPQGVQGRETSRGEGERSSIPSTDDPVQEASMEMAYEMTHSPRGICIIINNVSTDFKESSQWQASTDDADALKEVFTWLDFTVECHKDLTKDQMKTVLQEWSQKADGDCFVCCVLSHGEDDEVLPVEAMITPLKGHNCRVLAGKPKLFFIQTYRGKHFQKEVKVHAHSSHKDTQGLALNTAIEEIKYFPAEADFLVALSTMNEYHSRTHGTKGLWFTQSLCYWLKEGTLRGDDILTILTHVSNDISQKDGFFRGKKLKQVPMSFTLRKRLVFPVPHSSDVEAESPHHSDPDGEKEKGRVPKEELSTCGSDRRKRRHIQVPVQQATTSSSHSSDAAEMHLRDKAQQDPGAQLLSLDTPKRKRRRIKVPVQQATSSSHSSDAAELHLRDKAQQDPGAQLLSLDTPKWSCQFCADVSDPDPFEWNLVEPSISMETSVRVYSLSSSAGRCECSVSGLRWLSAGDVTLQYTFREWRRFKIYFQLSKFTPVGPLMDIMVLSGKIEEVHLPHFLCLGGSNGSQVRCSVRILHWSESGLSVESCELMRFHAKIQNPTFSPIVVVTESETSSSSSTSIVSGGSTGNPHKRRVHCKPLLYASYNPSLLDLTLRIYVFPLNPAVVEEVKMEEREHGNSKKILKSMRTCSLRVGGWFKFKTACVSTVDPEEITLEENLEGDILIDPIFTEVHIEKPTELNEIKLTYEQDDAKRWTVKIRETDYNTAQIKAATTETASQSALIPFFNDSILVSSKFLANTFCFPTQTARPVDPVPTETVAISNEEQVKKIRPELIRRSTKGLLKDLLDALQAHKPPVVSETDASDILEKTPVLLDQVTRLIDVVCQKGEKACGILLNLLKKKDPFLSDELGLHQIE